MTAAKNAIVSWLLNFRIRMFVKSAVILQSFLNESPVICQKRRYFITVFGTRDEARTLALEVRSQNTQYEINRAYALI